ncbi:hypothetical protein BC628DRAFT_71577 [Trametes gibbosa]|nr:hypothetical protein BC628DRAFT_71577 [Trametes gibbosa]
MKSRARVSRAARRRSYRVDEQISRPWKSSTVTHGYGLTNRDGIMSAPRHRPLSRDGRTTYRQTMIHEAFSATSSSTSIDQAVHHPIRHSALACSPENVFPGFGYAATRALCDSTQLTWTGQHGSFLFAFARTAQMPGDKALRRCYFDDLVIY